MKPALAPSLLGLDAAGGLRAPVPPETGGRYLRRLWALSALYLAEMVAISLWLDTGSLRGAQGLTALVAEHGPAALRFVVASALAWLVFGDSKSTDDLSQTSPAPANHEVAPLSLLAHLGLMVLFAELSSILFGTRLPAILDNALAVLWVTTGVAAAVLAGVAFLPFAFWTQLFRRMRSALVFALAVSIGAYFFGWLTMSFWRPLSRGTLEVACAILSPLVDGVSADPSTLQIGGPNFRVEVSQECSGYEGLGLILVFTAAWLWFHRAQWRFPHALVLVPLGLAAMWTINCVRIAALVYIGNAGAPAVAEGGFHSQAGWLGFIAVTLGICLSARRVQWLAKRDSSACSRGVGWFNPTAAYLIPFVAILAGAIVAELGSDGFEWLYPIRVIACAAALGYFARAYRSLDWRIGWFSPGLGCLVFVMWIGLEPLVGTGSSVSMPSTLSQAPVAWKAVWLAIRVLGAVVTVPIAEELAFRGFLLRRFMSVDFQSVSWQSISWIAVLLSSAAFGVLHGDRWLAGTIAGVTYAIALLRRGSLGDATVAHATTNALIAAWVLIGGHWEFW